MNIEENIAVVRRIVEEAFNKGNLSVIPELMAPHYIYHGAAGMKIEGIEGMERLVMRLRTALPDLHVTIEDIFGWEDKVAARLTYRGTHEGEWVNIHPTGKEIAATEIMIVHWQGGKEVESWGVFDRYGAMQQLGVIPTN